MVILGFPFNDELFGWKEKKREMKVFRVVENYLQKVCFHFIKIGGILKLGKSLEWDFTSDIEYSLFSDKGHGYATVLVTRKCKWESLSQLPAATCFWQPLTGWKSIWHYGWHSLANSVENSNLNLRPRMCYLQTNYPIPDCHSERKKIDFQYISDIRTKTH